MPISIQSFLMNTCRRARGTAISIPGLLCALFPVLFSSIPVQGRVREYDVVVYGGTASGVIAAVAAAREGAAVALLAPESHLGGMVSNGLGATDAGRVDTIGGLALEFFTRLGAHYGRKGPTFRHEPSAAESIFDEMIEEAGVEVFFRHRLRERGGVQLSGSSIQQIRVESGTQFRAKVFIDASYEGDLMAQAGVSYHVGRESRETYGESMAGIRPIQHYGKREIAFDEQGLLPDISVEPPGEIGDGDNRVQAYNFRLCLSRDPENQVPIGRPPRYDPRRYTLLSRVMMTRSNLQLRSFLSIAELPNNKSDVNNIGSLSTDLVGGNVLYPEGDYKTRARVFEDHRNYVHGLLYFLGNDSRVPQNVRDEMQEWGFAPDEFADNEYWPRQLYVRVARRMIGDYVMTQHDLKTATVKADSIGMGSYFLDSHYVRRVLTEKGVGAEGSLGGDHRVFPYEIPYRSLIPKAKECENLLVSVTMSASHVAYSSIRMEPVYMIMGHAAGVAGAMAAVRDISVQAVSYPELEEKLRARGQVLEYAIPGVIDPAALEGVIVDETEAELQGSWYKSTSGEPFVGLGYVHDNNTGKGTRIATFRPDLPEAGEYDVWLYYAPLGNRAANVPVTIRAANGEFHFQLNQRERFPDGEQAKYLGTFPFGEGRTSEVEVSNTGTDGYVVADAVQFVRASDSGSKTISRLQPAAGDAAAATSQTASTASEIRAAAQHCRELLRSAQLDDGAFRTRPHGDRVRIVPYFANNAAIALLAFHEVDPSPEDLARVQRWLFWYANHQEPDGTIQDYLGTLDAYERTERRDSTDSYAATFMIALARYSDSAGTRAFHPHLVRAAEKAVDAIALTFDESDGLTWAKPEYLAKFAMDNLEVLIGLTAGIRYLEEAGREESVLLARKMLEKIEPALPNFWLPDAGHFAWAKGSSGALHTGFDRWYPEAIVNLFFLIHATPAAPGLWDKLQDQFREDEKITPDWWARAAARAGTEFEYANSLRQTTEFAANMTRASHGINRYATTLLALLGEDAREPIIRLPLPVATENR